MKILIYTSFLIFFVSACSLAEIEQINEKNNEQDEKIAYLEDLIISTTHELLQVHTDQNLKKINDLVVSIDNESSRLGSSTSSRSTSDTSRSTTASSFSSSYSNTPITSPPTMNNDAESLRLYNEARKLYEARDPSAAIRVFNAVIVRNTDVELTANSYYWIGECYYYLEDYAAARLSFQKVVDQYPNSPKLVDSHVKIALTWIRHQQKDLAREILLKVKKDYPNYERMNVVEKNLKLTY